VVYQCYRYCADDLITVLTAASRGLPGTANRASVQQLLTELRSSSTAATDTAAAASITTAEGWEQRIQSWRLGVHTIQQVSYYFAVKFINEIKQRMRL
jgi:hypothetical protein